MSNRSHERLTRQRASNLGVCRTVQSEVIPTNLSWLVVRYCGFRVVREDVVDERALESEHFHLVGRLVPRARALKGQRVPLKCFFYNQRGLFDKPGRSPGSRSRIFRLNHVQNSKTQLVWSVSRWIWISLDTWSSGSRFWKTGSLFRSISVGRSEYLIPPKSMSGFLEVSMIPQKKELSSIWKVGCW